MKYSMRKFHLFSLSLLVLGLISSPQVLGQAKPQKAQREQPDDVVRVKTELVQTDITVVDTGPTCRWFECG